MRKLISLALLLSPLLAGLAFPAFGDTVTYDNVRYIITSETDSTSTYEVSLYQILEAPRILIPDKISYGGHNYEVTSISEDNTCIYPENLERDVYIDKIDFSLAAHIDTFPMSATWTGCTDIDTLILPPNLNYAAEFYALCSTEGYDEKGSRYLGIKRLFSSGTTDIDIESFQSCYALVEVDLSTTAIDSLLWNQHLLQGTFEQCYWLENIKLPETVRFFDGYTFALCTRLIGIDLPGSLEHIGQYCFARSTFKTLHIPSKVRYIDPTFVFDNYWLESISVAIDNPFFKSDSGVLCSKSGKTIYTIPYSLRKDRYIFPEVADSVNERAFARKLGYTGSESQLDTAVYAIDVIRHFVFNHGLRYLGESAFCHSPLETAENFGSTQVSIIPKDCFWGSNLRGIELPVELSVIEAAAFDSCHKIDSVRFLGSVISHIGEGAFRLCTSLDSLDISAQTRLKTIRAHICDGCTSLRSVKLPTSIDSIGNYAFSGCVSLSEIEVPVLDPIPVDESVFSGVDKSSCRLIVPAPSIGKYRAAPVWRDFLNIESGDLLTLTVLSADPAMGSVSPTTAYARHGDTVTITATPLSGYRFTLWSDSVTANPRDITVTRDTVLTAHFAPYTPDTFAVTLLCDSATGTVSGAGRYPEGTAATLTATPREGYAFTRWEDNHGLTFTDNPLTLTVTCDTLLTALFREDGTGHSPADDDGCAAWVTPDGTLRVRCPGCRLMELRTVTGLTLYSGAPVDIPLPHPGVYLLTLDGDTYKVMRR